MPSGLEHLLLHTPVSELSRSPVLLLQVALWRCDSSPICSYELTLNSCNDCRNLPVELKYYFDEGPPPPAQPCHLDLALFLLLLPPKEFCVIQRFATISSRFKL
ncbi:UNVERIFIED_CONTAM: hypothetical protein K2H54_058908 [Gekko kuhli]